MATGVISYVAHGSSGNGTTSVGSVEGLTLPVGYATGNLFLMHVSSKYAYPDTPSGWTLVNQVSGGSGASGEDSGTVYSSVYYRIATSTSETIPTVTLSGGNSLLVRISAYAKTDGNWSVTSTTGSQNSVTASWSVAMSTSPSITAGNWVVGTVSANGNDALYASTGESFTAPGLTMGTQNTRVNTGTASGNDVRLVITTHIVDSGTATGAGTFGLTFTGTLANGPAGAVIATVLSAPDNQNATVLPGVVAATATVPAHSVKVPLLPSTVSAIATVPEVTIVQPSDLADQRLNFDGGVNGNTIGETAEGFASGTTIGASVTYSSTRSITGSLSLYGSALTSQAWDRKVLLNAGDTDYALSHFCFYLYVDEQVPSGSNDTIATARLVNDGLSARMQINTTTGGQLRIANGITSVGTAWNIVRNEWMRIEWKLDAGAATQYLRVYTGANLHSSTTPTFETSGAYTDPGVASYTIGNANNLNTYTRRMYWDAVGWRLSDWTGPALVSGTQNATVTPSAIVGSTSITTVTPNISSSVNITTQISGSTTMAQPSVITGSDVVISPPVIAATGVVNQVAVNSPILDVPVTAVATVYPVTVASSSASVTPLSISTQGVFFDDFYSEISYTILPDTILGTTSMPYPVVNSSYSLTPATIYGTTTLFQPFVSVTSSNVLVKPLTINCTVTIPLPTGYTRTTDISVDFTRVSFAVVPTMGIDVNRPESVDRISRPLRVTAWETDQFILSKGRPVALPQYYVEPVFWASSKGTYVGNRQTPEEAVVGADIRWIASSDYYSPLYNRWLPTSSALAENYWWETNSRFAPELNEEFNYWIDKERFTEFSSLYFDQESFSHMWSSFEGGNSASDSLTIMMVAVLSPPNPPSRGGFYTIFDNGGATPPAVYSEFDATDENRLYKSQPFYEPYSGNRTSVRVHPKKVSITFGDQTSRTPEDVLPTFNEVGILTMSWNKNTQYNEDTKFYNFYVSWVGEGGKHSRFETYEPVGIDNELPINHKFLLGRESGNTAGYTGNTAHMDILELNMWTSQPTENELRLARSTLRNVYGLEVDKA